MKKTTAFLVIVTLLAPLSSAWSQGTNSHNFSFNAESIGDAPGSEAFLTGGGTYDLQSGFARGGGAFRCTSDITGGPLAGLKAGEGVRWDVEELLTSSGFKCGGVANEPLKTAVTDDDTVVLRVNFYRQGDGENASFSANIFVSASDEDPGQPGNQNVWIQGVGCTEAIVNVH